MLARGVHEPASPIHAPRLLVRRREVGPVTAVCRLLSPSVGARRSTVSLLLLVLLIVLLIGAVPAWPYSRSWGYYPSGGVGLVVLILVILLLTGRL
ncbi:MAG: DUF3309 domain-containing protein [Candidatus Rokubacteria bacterium]|nr:DUF3309 domain-containing protein [Candidatus Rokubacteria bacterium]